MYPQNDNEAHKRGRVHIWSHDCITICTVIGMAFDAKEIDEICTETGLDRCRPNDPDYQFYLFHRIAHNVGCPLALYFSELLNNRFSKYIEQCKNLKCSTEEQVAEELGLIGRTPPIGVIWALITDPRDQFYHHGVYLIHRASLKAFRDYGRENTELLRNRRLTEAAARTTDRALQNLKLQQTENKTLRMRLEETERERDTLKEELARQQG